MADYMVGRGGGGKDRYTVGWNESKSSQNAYKVGTSPGKGGGDVPSSKKLPADQDPVVGSKSQFSHADKDTADDGSASVNMGFGGSLSSGLIGDPTKAGGEVDLNYVERGDWSDAKNAIAKRKAQMEAFRQVGGASQYETPTVNMVSLKK